MKNKLHIALLTSVLALVALVFSCKKDEDPNIQSITFEREYFQYTPTSVTVSGVYAYDGRIDGIKMQVGQRNDLADARTFNANLDGTHFTVLVNNLQPGTEYHYCYEVDYGFSKPYKTETKTFATPADSPLVKTLEVMSLDSTTVRVKCEVVAEGGQEVTERGICWNTYGDPTLDDETVQHATGGVGQYTLRISGLALSTKYYVRAYAKNASGIGFGEVLEFETLAEALLPEVSTVEVGNVTSTTASCMGNVANDGGLELTERGVCWSLNANPTVTNSHAAATDATLGVFEVAMTGLTPNKTYHARAYATNAKGTAYGADLTFTTTEGLPVVTTSGITEITATSAKGGGEVTDQGASNVTERGICWGTSHNPTTAGAHASSGTGAGSYTVSMTNLTPNATYYVRAYATNSQGTAYGAEVSFTALEGLPVVLTLDMTDITSTTANGHGKVTDQGGSAVTERGICWSTRPSPTTSGSHANSSTGTGEYTVNISNLTPGMKYYVRAYATNSQGTTYGEQKDFTTAATLPTVVTGDISGTTAHGEVTNAGGAIVTERGICWGTSHNPTTAGTHGSSGTGTGSFSVELTNLAPGTTYYVRAYATNSAGTAYGSEKTLTTQATLPTVTTGEVSNITQTTAQGSGNVTNEGGAAVTERGVCWGTSHNPTISGSHAYNGTGTGSYTVNMTGLTANTHYYVRAYAKNSAGVSYGNEVDFTTAQNVSAPTVTTSQVTNVTQTTATGGGDVTSDGGATVTERGICWSTSHNPTTNSSHASSGMGTGSYTVNMTGLTPGTMYYVRAYAVNSQGTSYGAEVSFTTQQPTTYTITVSANPSNGGSAHVGSPTGPTTGIYTSGQSCIVYAEANSNYTFANWTENGSVVSTNASYQFNVTSNSTLVANFTLSGGNAPQGAINGLFTINSNGDQVYFSQGNLQYKASTNLWQFAANQYDYIGSANSNISSSYSGWIDLFGWGTSGYHASNDLYNMNYQPWSTIASFVNVSFNYYGYGPSVGMSSPNLTGSSANYDWGVYNQINNAANGWRTLTRDEWVWVLGPDSSSPGTNCRTSSTVNGTANARYVKAKVNSVQGVILFPDTYTHPSGVAQPIGINETGNAGWNGNDYSATEFGLMEQNGAVFLPASGYRNVTSVYSVGSSGSYWSTTFRDSANAYSVDFDGSSLYQEYGNSRYYGQSVRLVRDAQ